MTIGIGWHVKNRIDVRPEQERLDARSPTQRMLDEVAGKVLSVSRRESRPEWTIRGVLVDKAGRPIAGESVSAHGESVRFNYQRR